MRPTEVYHPTDEEDNNTEDGNDRIPPEAYSTNQPLQLFNARIPTPQSMKPPMFEESLDS